MTSARIRAAEPDDASAVSALSGQLGYPVTPEVIAERVAAARGQPHVSIVVAERDGRVIGWMQVSLRDALESGSWVEIDSIVVDESERGRGIGRSFVECALGWARTHGRLRLRVRTNQTRARTHTFYESCGFFLTKTQRVYDLPIPGRG